jgi:hypothetical protein
MRLTLLIDHSGPSIPVNGMCRKQDASVPYLLNGPNLRGSSVHQLSEFPTCFSIEAKYFLGSLERRKNALWNYIVHGIKFGTQSRSI